MYEPDSPYGLTPRDEAIISLNRGLFKLAKMMARRKTLGPPHEGMQPLLMQIGKRLDRDMIEVTERIAGHGPIFHGLGIAGLYRDMIREFAEKHDISLTSYAVPADDV